MAHQASLIHEYWLYQYCSENAAIGLALGISDHPERHIAIAKTVLSNVKEILSCVSVKGGKSNDGRCSWVQEYVIDRDYFRKFATIEKP